MKRDKNQLSELILVLVMSMTELLDSFKKVQHTVEEKWKSLYKWVFKHFLKVLFLGPVKTFPSAKFQSLTVLCNPLSVS